ncbi:DUF7523 family protein [Halobaculum gomorrense]|uniref:Uncharacterized protein n=1 Tax=Halobaculum gomorrense TaxID=43928 RepID=A0A1M5N297_9EURY|nr:hypothetical protein [Halobaculum gomorrense]SHG83696.1 hypothetical protein SAMN05443636_1236 [Halobaculum gomorrense]
MTVAEETRAAVRERPFLHDALRAGVVNYAAAAATLDIDADRDAVATALRRFADDLAAGAGGTTDGDVVDARVTMERGVGRVDGGGDAGNGADAAATDGDAVDHEALLSVGDAAFAVDAGDATAVLARGTVDAIHLERVLGRLRTAGVPVEAAGVTPSALLVVVGRRDGATALRVVETAVEGDGPLNA